VIFGGDQPLCRMNDNVDVEVRLSDGSRWSGTFFTIRNVRALFTKNRATGECANGLYLWAADMILVGFQQALTLPTGRTVTWASVPE
jgi:hypothetical protein